MDTESCCSCHHRHKHSIQRLCLPAVHYSYLQLLVVWLVRCLLGGYQACVLQGTYYSYWMFLRWFFIPSFKIGVNKLLCLLSRSNTEICTNVSMVYRVKFIFLDQFVWTLLKGWGEVQAQNFWKQIFEITVNPKVPPSPPTLWPKDVYPFIWIWTPILSNIVFF